VRLEADGATAERSLAVTLDPAVSMPASALLQQYDLAHKIAGWIDPSFDDAASARAARQQESADANEWLNAQFSLQLSIVDDADASPTAQAIRAASTLENSLQEAERTYRTHLPHKE
jgi:hypothetical protein